MNGKLKNKLLCGDTITDIIDRNCTCDVPIFYVPPAIIKLQNMNGSITEWNSLAWFDIL